jgi:putative transposase
MPRSPRLDAPGTLHHVIARGIERCAIFADDTDRSDLLQRLAIVLTASRSACYAWCLMPNHFHLLWRSGQAPLSRCLQRALGGYAGAFNRRHHRSGHLFQNRFKSTVVQDDLYLLELVRYIHLNPLRAHLVADLAALDTYAWTGHATLLGQHACPWQDTDAVLQQFAPTVAVARRAYRAFVVAGLQGPSVDLDGGGLRRSHQGGAAVQDLPRGRERWTFDERILGSAAFVSGVLTELVPTGAPSARRLEAAAVLPPLLAYVAQRLALTVTELTARSRGRDVVRARDIVSYVAVCQAGLPARQIAPWLKLSPRAVLDAVARGRTEALAQRILLDDFLPSHTALHPQQP